MVRLHLNDRALDRPAYPFGDLLSVEDGLAARAAISACPRYAPTPLIGLPDVADACGVGEVVYKHEADRFGLGSFKALGGAYAVAVALKAEVERELGWPVGFDELADKRHAAITGRYTAVSATDGNHGRSVAAGARHFGCGCDIFLHEHVSPGREVAIAAFDARIVRVKGDYDASVRAAAQAARAPGAMLLADGSTTDEQGLSRHVLQGYYVMTGEVLAEMAAGPPTHVFVQGGVGSLAAAVCAHFWEALGEAAPVMIVVEPDQADCLYQSALAGAPRPASGSVDSLMAGLACGEVSIPAWRILSAGARALHDRAGRRGRDRDAAPARAPCPGGRPWWPANSPWPAWPV